MDAKKKALEILAGISGKNASEIEPGMDLVGDLGIDSPHALQLLVELEEALDIEIDDDDAAKMDTVGDVYAYLETAVPG
jgi:acyl carrier protein